MVKQIVISTLFAVASLATASARDGENHLVADSQNGVAIAETPKTPEATTSSSHVGSAFTAATPASTASGRELVTGKETRRKKYDRGLAFDTKTPSMPKGLWIAGVTVSYSQQAGNDYRIFVVDKLNVRGNSFSINPMVHYVFANNQSIGVRFSYKRNLLDMGALKLSLTPELSAMLFGDGELRYNFQNQTYMGYVSYRYYVALGASKRIIIFNEVQAGVGGGQQKELSGWNDDHSDYKTGTYQKTINFRLGLAPGATFFVTNVLACEVQLGLMGYELKKMTQFGTNLPSAAYSSSSISTRFDFLSVTLGMSFHL